jgi:hypothetical protein
MKMRVLVGVLLIAAASLGAQAQAQGQGSAKAATEIIASSEKIVKGAPFSAEAMSESLQVLADGNRITRTASNKMFRDSDGRFRRNGMTLLGAFYELHPTVIILDPVNGFKYYVNSESKTIRKVTLALGTKIVSTAGGTYTFQAAPTAAIAAGEYEAAAKKLQTEMNARQAEYAKLAETAPLKTDLEKVTAAKALNGQLAVAGGVSGAVNAAGEGIYKTWTEELGVQTIEGVPAEGTRTVTTIPAGAIGNERPIDIVYERWYSKDLQLIVSSKHSDPRFGDQIYRLTNITRSEPDNSLFTIPADYKITFEPMPGFGTPKATGTSPTPGVRVRPAPSTAPTPPPPAPKPKTII